MKTTLILACAGKGQRAGFNKNKLLIKFNGQSVLEKTLSVFLDSGLIDEYVVTISSEDKKEISSILPDGVKVVLGGKIRSESIKNALEAVTGDVVVIHDGARPFVSKRIIADSIDSAVKYGSGLTAIKTRDTVLKSDENINYLGKEGLYLVQTPQTFQTEKIKKAYSLAGNKSFNDDGEVYQKYIGKLSLVEGEKSNVKLTFKEDFDCLSETNANRIGNGFDCHKFAENRKLILGGIEIPYEKGLLGHSDADVLTHAIMDALLSAVSERDIGYHFPDTDDKYKDADSMLLLKEVLKIVDGKGYKVQNVSAVIMAEKPKLIKYIPFVTNNLAKALGVSPEKVGIGATTLEGLGFVGREEGICVSANALLTKKQ